MTAKISKFLSYILRHNPSAVDIQLDDQGWVNLDELVVACQAAGKDFTRDEVLDTVRQDEKQRYALSEDGKRIRANQGHSIEIDLAYTPSEPPETLFHGTATHFKGAILEEGLKKMGRHHVHLSSDQDTAVKVGSRHGKPLVLIVKAKEMSLGGHTFFVSANGVWLTEHVPPEFLVLTETV